jgi:hypothetical protein
MSDDLQVMRAVATGNIRSKVKGVPGTIVRKGQTTAHAGHPLVKAHPKLWAPIAVDYPLTGADELLSVAGRAANASHTEALRYLFDQLVERGYEFPEDPGDDVARQIVDVALEALDSASARASEALGLAAADPHPVAGDLRRTESGQLQEYGEGIWHDVDEATGLRAGGILPGPGPVVGEDAPNPDPISTPHGPADTGVPADQEDAALAGDAATGLVQDDPSRDADPTTTDGRRLIRQWARDQDIDVAATGTIPHDVMLQWAAAHGRTL